MNASSSVTADLFAIMAAGESLTSTVPACIGEMRSHGSACGEGAPGQCAGSSRAIRNQTT